MQSTIDDKFAVSEEKDAQTGLIINSLEQIDRRLSALEEHIDQHRTGMCFAVEVLRKDISDLRDQVDGISNGKTKPSSDEIFFRVLALMGLGAAFLSISTLYELGSLNQLIMVMLGFSFVIFMPAAYDMVLKWREGKIDFLELIILALLPFSFFIALLLGLLNDSLVAFIFAATSVILPKVYVGLLKPDLPRVKKRLLRH